MSHSHKCTTCHAMCHPIPNASKNVKFRLSRNPTKFDGVTRYLEKYSTVKSVLSYEIKKISRFQLKLPFFRKIEFFPSFTMAFQLGTKKYLDGITLHVNLLLENPLAPYGFYPFGWVNQSPYLVFIHGIHFDFMATSHLLNSELFIYSSSVVGSSSSMSNTSFCSLMRN